MQEDDPTLLDSDASADGILQCLRMLADEAADLRLASTLKALRDAIDVCQSERLTGGISMGIAAQARMH
jgi:hypothetical protein